MASRSEDGDGTDTGNTNKKEKEKEKTDGGEEEEEEEEEVIPNVNIGVLGHVDSGKTALVRSISEQISTAALDKHPQSKERGITLDLGFSALRAKGMSLTLVDCPGHASLLRTVIGGANIIDVMILVVDAVKGMQTQTAECLVVGELLTDKMVVVLNKVDMLPEELRQTKLEKLKRRMANTLANTRFAGAPCVAVSACPGADEAAAPEGVEACVETIAALARGVRREYAPNEALLFSVDHCFPMKGKGTVLTGTILRGEVRVNDTVELPELGVTKKVKSMQMFHRPVTIARCGDRLGMCVTQFDAKLLERGLVAAPGTLPPIKAAVAAVEKVRFYKGDIRSKQKLNIIVGHMTSQAQMTFFTDTCYASDTSASKTFAGDVKEAVRAFDIDREYVYSDELHARERKAVASEASGTGDEDHSTQKNGHKGGQGAESKSIGRQYCLLEFEQPIFCSLDAVLIGVKLDTGTHSNACRIGFHGRIAKTLSSSSMSTAGADSDAVRALKIYKTKQRDGVIERLQDEGRTAICKGMFKKETDINVFAGLRVTASTGGVGTIEGAFGKSGKFKVGFPNGIGGDSGGTSGAGTRIKLEFQRFIFDKEKKMRQSDMLVGL